MMHDPDDPGPVPDFDGADDDAPLPPVRPLAEDATPAPAGAAVLPPLRTLREVLPALREEREPSAAGGVPLPLWPMARALLGGASAEAVEIVGRGGGGDLMRAERIVAAARQHGAFLPAGLHVITGTTGGGKTALVVNLAHAAAHGAHPVLYVTLELDAEEIAARLAALAGAGAWWALAQHRAPKDDTARAMRDRGLDQADADAGALVHILALDGTCDDPCGAIATHARHLWLAHGRVPLVVLDYLQLLTVRQGNGYRAPLREAITSVTVALRTLSRRGTAETDATWPGCPVVVLSTTARGNVKGADAITGLVGGDPDELRHVDEETLKALPKEAGEIEATAVSAWVVALGPMRTDTGTRPLTLRLAKYRYGPAGGWVPFTFSPAAQRMEEEPDRYILARTKDEASAREAATKSAKKPASQADGARSIPSASTPRPRKDLD